MRNFGFLKNYLLFALVSMLLLLPIYGEAYHLLEQEARENTGQDIEQGIKIFTDEVESVSSIFIRFPSNRYFSYVRSWKSPGRSEDHYAMYSIKNYMADITTALSLPCQNIIWFSNGLIVTDQTVYSRPEQYGYNLFHTKTAKNISEWFATFAEKGYRYRFIQAEQFTDAKNGDYEALPLVYTYSSADSEETAVWVSLFDLDTIYELMGLNHLQDKIHMQISSTETGEMIYDNNVTISGSSIPFQCITQAGSLCFYLEIPKNYFTDQMRGMWIIAIVYLILFVLIAILMAIVLARKTALPVHNIVTTLSRYTEDNGKEPGNYADIERSIMKIGDKGRIIMDAHGKLNEKLYQLLLREQIVSGLDGRKFKKPLKNGIALEKPFRLILLQLTEIQQDIPPEEIEELITESKLYPIFFCRAKANLFLCIIQEEEKEILHQKLEKLAVIMKEINDYNCIIFVSVMLSSLEHIHEYYQQGRYGMKYFSVQKIIFQDEIAAQTTACSSTVDLTENIKLTDLILDGRREEAEIIISRQWYQVSIAREYTLMEQLYYMQTAVLNRLAIRLGSKQKAAVMEYNDIISDTEQKILEFARYLCELALQRKQDTKNELPGKIVAYIDAHYTDPDFYLGTLVEKFNLSDKTITKLIRGYCDRNFSSYVEGLRIKKARILLEDPKLSISTIAQKSGFGSENTFYKAFKRVYNVSPGTYRGNLQGLENEK